MMKKFGLLLLILGLITGSSLIIQAQDGGEEELLALDESTMNSILDELIGQMGEEEMPEPVRETTAKESRESAPAVEKLPDPAAEEALEKSAMTVPASYDEADSAAGMPMEEETAGFEPFTGPEDQAAGTVVAEPPEPEALQELAATAETPEVGAFAEDMESAGKEEAAADIETAWGEGTAAEMETAGMEEPAAEMETAGMEEPAAEMETAGMEEPAAEMETAGVEEPAAEMETAGMEEAAADMEPAGMEEAAAEAEPPAFMGEEDMDFQAAPETGEEVASGPAAGELAETEAGEDMFGSGEDIASAEAEYMDPAAEVSQPLEEDYEEAAYPAIDAPPGEEQDMLEMGAPAAVAAGSRGKMIKPGQMVDNSIEISRQRDDHLLITVGDLVFLPTPTFKTIRPKEKYFIYKKIKKRGAGTEPQALTWFEKVGKLKILEINNQLSVARVIAANDIIEKGDMVYLSNYP